jgi:hypothetical protein
MYLTRNTIQASVPIIALQSISNIYRKELELLAKVAESHERMAHATTLNHRHPATFK